MPPGNPKMISPSIHAVRVPPVAPAGARHVSVTAGGTQERDGLSRRAKRRRGGRRGSGRAPVLAVLDLGSNNCRLLIARPAADGGFRVVDSFSRIVRLGEGVAQTRRLSEAAIARTLAALGVCAEHIRANGATHVYAIATAAAREACNAQELVERARAETGIALTIVTPEEEARLAATGCAPLIGADYEGALVFDIGGGSTEIIWMRRDGASEPRIVHFASVPVGVVTPGGGHRPRRDGPRLVRRHARAHDRALRGGARRPWMRSRRSMPKRIICSEPPAR